MATTQYKTLSRMLFLVWLLCSGLLAAEPGPRVARVEPGTEYIHHRIGDGPWSIHVVKISRSRPGFRFVSSLAKDTVYGLASVGEQVEALPAEWGRPVAAVNGDFFHIRSGPYQGDPIGLHVAGGELVSSPAGTSFWIDQAGRPHIGQVKARFRAAGSGGLNLAFGLNEKRADDKAVLYTPTVGESTRTSGGIELLLQRQEGSPWLPLRPGGCYRATVSAINEHGDTRLTPERMVLSVGPALAETLPPPTTGMEISLSLSTSPDLSGVTLALGGGPILLDGGTSPHFSPPLPRHPRTVLGWNEAQFFLVVVDGRQEGLSVGMTYPELSSLMRRLGCTHAMNLDGGGSSTLWLDGHIMNSPSDGRERRVANSLIVVFAEHERSDGTHEVNDVEVP